MPGSSVSDPQAVDWFAPASGAALAQSIAASTIDETQAEKKSQLSGKKGYGSMNKRSRISDKKKSGNQ